MRPWSRRWVCATLSFTPFRLSNKKLGYSPSTRKVGTTFRTSAHMQGLLGMSMDHKDKYTLKISGFSGSLHIQRQSYPSIFNAEINASCGMSTRPNYNILHQTQAQSESNVRQFIVCHSGRKPSPIHLQRRNKRLLRDVHAFCFSSSFFLRVASPP